MLSTSDKSFVNAVAVNNRKSFVCLWDDNGKLRMFSYPCVWNAKDIISKTFSGHSSHVTNIIVSPDDQFVFSIGGADNSVFQYIHKEK